MIIHEGTEIKTEHTRLPKVLKRGGLKRKKHHAKRHLIMPGATVLERIMASSHQDGDCRIWDGPMYNRYPRVHDPNVKGNNRSVRQYIWIEAGRPYEQYLNGVPSCGKRECISLDHTSVKNVFTPERLNKKHGAALLVNRRIDGLRVWRALYSDVSLAREFGITRERVRQILQAHGLKPRTKNAKSPDEDSVGE